MDTCDVCGCKTKNLLDYYCMLCDDCKKVHTDIVLLRRIGALIGVDYPKKFSQKDIEILILSQKRDLERLRKELKEVLIDNMEYNNLLKNDDPNLTIIRTPFKIIDTVFARYGVE